MSLAFRKKVYLVLGLGALYAAFVALLGLTISLATGTFDQMFFQSAGGILGVWSGIFALVSLPIKVQRLRVALTFGIVIGFVALSSVLSNGVYPDQEYFEEGILARILPLYVYVLPLFVGCALLIEIWVTPRARHIKRPTG